MRIDNTLLIEAGRQAELDRRNQERRRQWAARWKERFGIEPRAECGRGAGLVFLWGWNHDASRDD